MSIPIITSTIIIVTVVTIDDSYTKGSVLLEFVSVRFSPPVLVIKMGGEVFVPLGRSPGLGSQLLLYETVLNE
jgi:hypothetical protein